MACKPPGTRKGESDGPVRNPSAKRLGNAGRPRNRGEVGTVCIYEAESEEAIRAHAADADLPVDEVVAVADTVIVRPDPTPVEA